MSSVCWAKYCYELEHYAHNLCKSHYSQARHLFLGLTFQCNHNRVNCWIKGCEEVRDRNHMCTEHFLRVRNMFYNKRRKNKMGITYSIQDGKDEMERRKTLWELKDRVEWLEKEVLRLNGSQRTHYQGGGP